MNQILQGGCYKTEFGWLIVGTRQGDFYQCRDIEIEGGDYDEEIRDMTENQIREIADIDICYRPYYSKNKGLYAVWDECNKPHSEKIILQ